MPAPAKQPPTEELIDMEWLFDFAEGNPETLRDIIDLYLGQTAEQIQKLTSVIQAADLRETERIAHSCAGSSAACGIVGLSKYFRNIEENARQQTLLGAAETLLKINSGFQQVKLALTGYLKGA